MQIPIEAAFLEVYDGDARIAGHLNTITLCNTLNEDRDEVQLYHLLQVNDSGPMMKGESHRKVAVDLTAYRLDYAPQGDGYGLTRSYVLDQTHFNVVYDTLSGKFSLDEEVILSIGPGEYAPAIEIVQVVSFERLDSQLASLGGSSDEKVALLSTCEDDEREDVHDEGGDEDEDLAGPLPGYGTFCSYKDPDSAESRAYVVSSSRGSTLFAVTDLTVLAQALGVPSCDPGKLTQYVICTTLQNPGGLCDFSPCSQIAAFGCNPCPENSSNVCTAAEAAIVLAGEYLYTYGVAQRELILSFIEGVWPYGSLASSAALPGSSGRTTSVFGQGTANGQFCITVPANSVSGNADDDALATMADNAGDPNPGINMYMAAVGDQSICEEDKAKITQASSVVAASYQFINGEPGYIERNWKAVFSWGAACLVNVAAVGAAGGAAIVTSPTGAPALALAAAGAVAAAGAGVACSKFVDAAEGAWNPGWIRCGYMAAGVTFGGQDSESDLEALPTVGGLIDWSLTSGSTETQSWWFAADGATIGTGPDQPYVGVHDPIRLNDYKVGKGNCERAADMSQKEAEHQAATWGTVDGRDKQGNAAVDITVNLLPPIYIDGSGSMVNLGNDLWWSPVYGLSVACDGPTNCPLQLGISASQCGKVTVKGGAEMTYDFVGQPQYSECELMLSVHLNGHSTPLAQVPLLVLELHYEAAGNE